MGIPLWAIAAYATMKAPELTEGVKSMLGAFSKKQPNQVDRFTSDLLDSRLLWNDQGFTEQDIPSPSSYGNMPADTRIKADELYRTTLQDFQTGRAQGAFGSYLAENEGKTPSLMEFAQKNPQLVPYITGDTIKGLQSFIPEQPKPQIFGSENVGFYTGVPGAQEEPRLLVEKKQTSRQIERSVDLGDRQRIYYTDGTSEDIQKGTRPGGGGTPDETSLFSQEEIDLMGAQYNLTGKLPALGMRATGLRQAILQSAARQAIQAGMGATDVIGSQADTKAISGSIANQEKQLGAMGSFVSNLEMQVDKVKELSKDLQTYDTRLLNVPLRAMRGRIMGSPLQAKYDMYLAEIESEIGKLATGSSASVAELSVGAQEKWARIHDKNLSVKDMLQLLEETKAAGRMRMKSVEDQLSKTRQRMKTRKFDDQEPQTTPAPDSAVAYLHQNPQFAPQFKQKYGYLPEGF
jgi:hypothetical protein